MRIGFIRVAMIFLVVSVMSCATSKQNGFSYRPAHTGPDVSGVVSEEPAAQALTMNESPQWRRKCSCRTGKNRGATGDRKHDR
jgi:hypothetical protein